jgi:elongation factor Ts
MKVAATTEQIRRLREETGAGIMDCKRALEETGGDAERARSVLRDWGVASVAKKASREARQGLVESYIHAGGRVGALVEVNCETDFVARTDQFRTLAREIAMQVAAMNPQRIGTEESDGQQASDEPSLLDQSWIRDSSRTIRDLVNDAIAQLGENVVVRRISRFELGA